MNQALVTIEKLYSEKVFFIKMIVWSYLVLLIFIKYFFDILYFCRTTTVCEERKQSVSKEICIYEYQQKEVRLKTIIFWFQNSVKMLLIAIRFSPYLKILIKTPFLRFDLNPRFKNFGSSRKSLNPTLRPNLRPNSDDSLCHVIDSCKIFGST